MNFSDILSKHNVPHHTSGGKTRPGWINLRCPRCDKDPYLGYNIAGRYANCWACGPVPLVEVLQVACKLTKFEAIALCADLPQERIIKRLEHTGTLKRPYEVASASLYHWDYVVSRRLKPLEVFGVNSLWRVGGIGQTGGKLKWRLYIPIYLRGVEVSWTTRTIGEASQPRYISARDEESAVPIRNLLYGIDYVANSCIVLEGPLDVWAVGPGAVCQFGLRTSIAQLAQLSRIPNRWVCFDSEPEAQRRARKLCDDLSVFPGTTKNIVLESGNDPCEASEHEQAMLRSLLI